LTYCLHEPTGRDLVTPRVLTKSDLLQRQRLGYYGIEYLAAYSDAKDIEFAQPILDSTACTLYAEIYATNGLATAGWGCAVAVWNTAITHCRRFTMNGVTALISWQEYNGSANGVASQTKTLNTWLALAGVSDDAAIRRLYVNGVSSADDTTSVTGIAANRTFIGSSHGANYWDGGIRNVRAWSRNLGSDEVREVQKYPFAMLVGDPRRLYFDLARAKGTMRPTVRA
jgi:hypothetical protein